MRFSVIVPVYNAQNTLRRCVESILASGGDRVEIILVEDRSKDRGWDLCRELAAQYSNVIALRNEVNQGVSYTRNRGLEASTGEYILFVDSDDWVDSAYVSAFEDALNAGADFAVCGFVNHDELVAGRTDVYSWTDFEGSRVIQLRPELEKLHKANLLQQLWNKVFSRRIVAEHGIRFDETISIGEDTRFVLDYIRCANVQTATLINRPLYHYMRDQAGSLMYHVGYESIEEPLKNLRTMYTLMGKQEDEIDGIIAKKRVEIKENYAYLIMHNLGMSLRERRRLILALDEELGGTLYRKNLILFWKEKISSFLKR